jgi:hypothetical protein
MARWKRGATVPIAVMAVVLVAGLMNGPTAKAAAAARSAAAASSAPCTFGGPSGVTTCSSTDPTVTKVAYSGSADCSTTSFNWQITWGDSSSAQMLSGYGSAPNELEPIATHTYHQPGTYSIHVTGQPTNGGGCTWNPTSYEFTLVQSSAPSCDSSYLTVVTDNAGYAVAALPELFADKVSVTWCTGSGGAYVRILSASQHPSVEEAGFSVSGAEIRALKSVGIEFGVTPTTGPAPAIVNASDDATATASGLSFTGDFNLGEDMVDFVLKHLAVKPLTEEIAPLIRHGDLGRVSQVLLEWWNKFAVAYSSWVRNFGLPGILTPSVEEDMPVDKIVEKVVKLTGTLASMTAQTLAALNTNVTTQDVIDAVKHAIQQEADFLDWKWTAWAPQITVKVGPAALVHVNVGGRADLAITVDEDPSPTTTP